MKELIRKDKLISWSYGEPKYDDSRNDRTDMRDYINELPTVTEQEIRNKVIDEFSVKLKNFIRSQIEDAEYFEDAFCDIYESDIDELAEQMKEVRSNGN